jgi:uncharacterized membrane protein YebE (DUF533 family)
MELIGIALGTAAVGTIGYMWFTRKNKHKHSEDGKHKHHKSSSSSSSLSPLTHQMNLRTAPTGGGKLLTTAALGTLGYMLYSRRKKNKDKNKNKNKNKNKDKNNEGMSKRLSLTPRSAIRSSSPRGGKALKRSMRKRRRRASQ